MIINDRRDLDSAPNSVREQFMARLAGSINKYRWDGTNWVLEQDTSTISKFDFAVTDFPDAPVPDKPTYNPHQQYREALADEVPDERKKREAEGVTISGIRYAGDPENRQALSEALQFANQSGAKTFDRWKDSDGQYHTNHPVSDVQAAYESIGARRSALIGLESGHIEAVLSGTVTDLDSLDWNV